MTTIEKNPKTITKSSMLIDVLEPYLDENECDQLLSYLENKNKRCDRMLFAATIQESNLATALGGGCFTMSLEIEYKPTEVSSFPHVTSTEYASSIEASL